MPSSFALPLPVENLPSPGNVIQADETVGGFYYAKEKAYYDAAGNATDTAEATGNGTAWVWTHQSYDNEGNVTSVTRDYCQDSSPQAPGYSASCAGHLNLTWSYGYTAIGGVPRLTEITGPPGYAHTKMEYYLATGSGSEEGIAGRVYRVKRVVDATTEDVLAAYTYVLTTGASYGQVKTVTASGAATIYSYDAAGALTGVTLPKNSGTANPAVGYTVNALYQVTQVTDQANAATALEYDAAGRTSEKMFYAGGARPAHRACSSSRSSSVTRSAPKR